MQLEQEKKYDRRHVPWFNMEEWDQVYRQIYSHETSAQTKGFEQLLLWKARCPQLIPAGVLCTIDLIQVCLKDREVWPHICSGAEPPYRQYDLQLMYSVAVMRFLNHLALLTTRVPSGTLYEFAQKLHIPDWVVSIRHDTAHGLNLPSLSILRSAAHFCLDWIHEHYWKTEAETNTNWVVAEKLPVSRDIVEMWQVVMLYSVMGVSSVKKIPDQDLRKALLERIDTLKKGRKKKNRQKENYNDLSTVQLHIIQEIETSLSCSDYGGLIQFMLEEDSFLASQDFLSMFDGEGGLPPQFVDMWAPFVEIVCRNQAMPVLLLKLIEHASLESESSHRRRVAALWVKELILKTGMKMGAELLNAAVSKPTSETNVFLTSLMDAVEPPLPAEVRDQLVTLVSMYTQQVSAADSDSDDEIYTKDKLLLSAERVRSESHWILCDGGAGWHDTPLGRLPWQRDDSSVAMQLPCNTVWLPVKSVDYYSLSQTSLPGFFHEKINWGKLLKRPRKDRLMSDRLRNGPSMLEAARLAVENAD